MDRLQLHGDETPRHWFKRKQEMNSQQLTYAPKALQVSGRRRGSQQPDEIGPCMSTSSFGQLQALSDHRRRRLGGIYDLIGLAKYLSSVLRGTILVHCNSMCMTSQKKQVRRVMRRKRTQEDNHYSPHHTVVKQEMSACLEHIETNRRYIHLVR
jgi:hypothetical protein